MLDGLANATIYNINYNELFVGVPGVVVAGWVGFGLFIGAFLLNILWAYVNFTRQRVDTYEIAAYCVLMIVSYLMAALEQFVVLRDDHQHVNLLMAIVNGIVWVWIVLGSIRKVDETELSTVLMYERRYVLGTGICAQILYAAAAVCTGGVVFFLWAFGGLLMYGCIAIYVSRICTTWSTTPQYLRAWTFFAVGYTALYTMLAFLSHLFLGVMSLPAAVWTYLVLHCAAFILFAAFQRIRTSPTGIPTTHGNARPPRSAFTRPGDPSEISVSPNGLDD